MKSPTIYLHVSSIIHWVLILDLINSCSLFSFTNRLIIFQWKDKSSYEEPFLVILYILAIRGPFSYATVAGINFTIIDLCCFLSSIVHVHVGYFLHVVRLFLPTMGFSWVGKKLQDFW